ncbi:MAG: hypothetical protein ACKVHR_17390 [Pirellulales bacterium]
MECPDCGGAIEIIRLLPSRQADVIQRILRHCGLWQGFLRTHASPRAPRLPRVDGEGLCTGDSEWIHQDHKEDCTRSGQGSPD